ncbi:MAG: redoxin domain-containing protein [Phycisphaerales bacterium]|nr:redoxin domain-containing protein [Phycisphaerales bacterium]
MAKRSWMRPIGAWAIGLMLIVAPAAAQEKTKDSPKDEKPSGETAKSDAPKTDAPSAEIEKAAPDFELKGTDGKTYKLSELKEKTVILEWISKDCPTCKQQKSQMKDTAEALAKKGAVWLAIDSTGNRKPEDNVAYVKDNKLPYQILDDSAGVVGRAYGAKRTPTMYVIHKGKLVYKGALIPQKGDERNYVTEVVEAVSAGKEPPVKQTDAYG